MRLDVAQRGLFNTTAKGARLGMFSVSSKNTLITMSRLKELARAKRASATENKRIAK